VHHAPAGPPLSARVSALLARTRLRLTPATALLGVLRRTRLLPVVLTGVVLGVLVVVLPMTPYGEAPTGTAAMTSPSQGGQELVPATGDGWTEDGVPAEDPPTEQPAVSSAGEQSQAEAEVPAGIPSSSPSASSSSSSSSSSTPAFSPFATGTPSSPDTSAGPASSPTTESSASPRPAPAPSSDSAPAPEPALVVSAADQVLAQVDAARTSAGCGALSVDGDLSSAAAAHSASMRDAGSLDVPLDGDRPSLVAGGASDPAAVVAGWLADPEDAAALLDCTLSSVGVADADGWWTLLLT
jgi:uncharacterized protein YkwD